MAKKPIKKPTKKRPVGVPKNWNSMTETQKFVYSRNPSKKKPSKKKLEGYKF